jgi:photoactive yellow protein
MSIASFARSVESFLSSKASQPQSLNNLAEAVPASNRTDIPQVGPIHDQPTQGVSRSKHMVGRIDDVVALKTEDHIENMEYGAMEVDRAGTILRYNDAEAEISGRNPEDSIGLNFFTEIAPCTRKPEFLGRFMDGVKNGNLDCSFEFLFDTKMKPTRVWISMKKSPWGDTYWIFCKRM